MHMVFVDILRFLGQMTLQQPAPFSSCKEPLVKAILYNSLGLQPLTVAP